MPQLFRKPQSSTEEGWSPPDYFTPIEQSNSKEWKPPDYFTPIEEEKKPSVFSRAIEALKLSKSFKPVDVAKIAKDSGGPNKDLTREDTNILGFNQDKWSDMASKLPERWHGLPIRYPAAFGGSLAGTLLEAFSAPENVAISGAGVMSKSGAGVLERELPIRQVDRITNPLRDTTPQQDAVAIAQTREGVPRTPANISTETGIPKSLVRRTISELKKKTQPKRLYNSMPEVTIGKGQFPNTFGRKISIYDPKGQITLGEMKAITSNSSFHTLVSNIAGTLDEAMKIMNNPEWTNRLEKIGIIFDDKFHGIHIPNPGSGKSAILINPFIAIRDMSSDEASANILHSILHEMAHIEPSGPGHNEAFTVRLGDIYGRFGARRSVEAQDQILNSIADKNTGVYHSEIQEILSTYKESRGREATTEDLLSGTGIGSKSKGGGETPIPSSDKSDGEGASAAVDKLFRSLLDAKERNVSQEAINKTERARRFAAFAGVKQEGVAGAAKSLGKLRGEFEKVNPGDRLNLNQNDTDSLFTAVKRAKITEGEKARGYTALFKLLNGETVPQRNELRILDDVFGNGFADKIVQMHGGLGAVGIKLSKLANTMKSMENSLSLAAPLRHGIGLVYREEFRPAFKDMFKFFANKEYYDTSMQKITERPNYLLKKEAGLFTAKPGSLLQSEEEFLNSYIGEVPVVRNIVGASQRGYVGFLNKLRDDVSENMLKTAKTLGYDSHTMIGVPTKETKAIMRFVNIFTGRGELPFGLEKATNELNVLLWSPRMMASRIQMFTNPKIYTNLPKGMRLEGLKSLLGVASLGTIIDTALAFAGAKISYNILSTDFGKSRFGKKLVDPWGGLQQYVVGAARFLAGKTDSSTPTNRLQIAGQFLANKESPAASLAHTLLTAKKFTGKSDDTTTAGNFTDQYGNKTSIQSEIGKQFVPIFLQDLHDLAAGEPSFSENIGLDLIMGTASLAGMAQDYPEKNKGKLHFKKMKLH